MPRVKSTQVPERSVSATPPASIPLQVGSAAAGRRAGAGLWTGRPAPPAPPHARPSRKLETEREPGLGREAETQAPPSWPVAGSQCSRYWRRARSAASCGSADLSRHPSLPAPCLPLGPPRPQPLLSHRPTSLSGRPQNKLAGPNQTSVAQGLGGFSQFAEASSHSLR